MKNLIKLLIFIFPVLVAVNAQQDYFKNISWYSKYRTRFTDHMGAVRNRIGKEQL